MQGGKGFPGLLQLFAAVPLAVLPLPQHVPPLPEQPCVTMCHPIRLSLGLFAPQTGTLCTLFHLPRHPHSFCPLGHSMGHSEN